MMDCNADSDRGRAWRATAGAWLAPVLALALAFCAAGCAKDDAPAPEPAELPPPPPPKLIETGFPYEVGGETRQGHLAWWNNLTSAPLLLLLHDKEGIDGWIRGRANGFARMGYVVVVPDMTGLDARSRDQEVIDHLDAVVAEAGRRVGYTTPPRIGVVGYGLGGVHALTAARYKDLAAAVLVGSPLLTREEALLRVNEPLLGIFGGQDPDVPMSDVSAFDTAMRRVGGRWQANIWQDEGAGFVRRPKDPIHAREAELEIVGWLDTYLPP